MSLSEVGRVGSHSASSCAAGIIFVHAFPVDVPSGRARARAPDLDFGFNFLIFEFGAVRKDVHLINRENADLEKY